MFRLCQLLVMIAMTPLLLASEALGWGDTLNPKTYTSPSGEWSIFVKPDTIAGDAGATYTLKHRGEQTWSKSLPFALWDAAITDSGVTAGFAYQNGLDGRGWGNGNRDQSLLYVVILDEKGEIRLKDERERKDDASVAANPPLPYFPVATGLLVSPSADSFVVRTDSGFDADDEEWWRYRLSTGEKLGDIVPDQPKKTVEHGLHKGISAMPVPGTPLAVVHWYIATFEVGKRTSSAMIQLLNLEGNEVWRLDLPDEYTGLGSDWHWHFDLVDPGIRQLEAGDRAFSVRSYSLKQKVSFSIEPDAAAPSGWKVTETKRIDDALHVGRAGIEQERAANAGGKAASERPAATPLTVLGTIRLGAAPDAATPFGKVRGFSIDDQSRLGFVRSSPDRGMNLVLVSAEGKVVHDLPLPEALGDRLPEVVWLAPGKWLVHDTGLGTSREEGRDALAFILDVATGQASKLTLGLGGIRTAAATGDGGFVVIGGEDWVFGRRLIAFDPAGVKAWEAELTSPDDLAVTSTGEVVVLDGSDRLRFFSRTGEPIRTVEIANAINGRPNYPAGVSADADGGVILEDFGGTPSMHRISAAGESIGGFTPAFADGRGFRVYGRLQRAPDGTLWTSDSHSLLRLSAQGVVEKVLGPEPGEGGLTGIRALTVAPDGRIFAINERDASVHAFAKDGTPLRVLRPESTDFSIDTGIGSITLAGAGEVFYLPDDQYKQGRKGYLHFDAAGNRVGFAPFRLGQVSEDWLFKPGSHERWILGYESIALAGADGAIIREIKKRPNGDWIERVNGGAVAPDGSLAVVASPSGFGMRGPATINVYKPDGEPVRTLPLDGQSVFARLAFTGTHAISTDGPTLQVHPVDGGPVRHFTLPTAEGRQGWWTIFYVEGSGELWGWNSGTLEVHRFEMP